MLYKSMTVSRMQRIDGCSVTSFANQITSKDERNDWNAIQESDPAYARSMTYLIAGVQDHMWTLFECSIYTRHPQSEIKEPACLQISLNRCRFYIRCSMSFYRMVLSGSLGNNLLYSNLDVTKPPDER